MFSRHLLAAVVVCLSLALGLALQQSAAQEASNDEEPHPAVQLHEQGLEAFEAGDYEEAYELLQRVDAMQLSSEQRAEQRQVIDLLDAHRAGEIELPAAPAEPEPDAPAEPAEPEAPAVTEEPAEPTEPTDEEVVEAEETQEPAETVAPEPEEEVEVPAEPAYVERMREADDAARRGDDEQAATLYREVIADDETDADTRNRAGARLAEVRRRLDAGVIEAREAMDAARSDLDAGRYDEAEARLDEVRGSGVALGWFDEQRLDRLSERVAAEREAALALAAEEEAAPEPEEPVELVEEEPAELEEIEEPIDPAYVEQMREADEAARRGEHQRAATLYRDVSRDDEADADTRARASARLAEMRRRIDAEVIEAREAMDAARADIDAGRYERAGERLAEVRGSGVALGWFDQQRLDQLSERVTAEQEAALALAAEEEAAPEPAEPAEPEEPTEVVVDEPEEPAEPEEPTDVEVAEAEEPAPAVTDDMLEGYRLARAEQRLAEAREAAEVGQYNLAIRHYEAALRLEPEDAEAIRDELEEVRARRATAQVPEEPIEREAERQQLLRERAIAVYEQRMNEAQRLRQRGEFPAAQDAVARAQTVIDDNRSLLGERRYQQLHAPAERLATELAQERRQAEERRIRDVELTAREEQLRQREEIRAEREREVQRLLRRAHELRLDMQYEQALQLIDQALNLDPTNWATQSMKVSIEDAQELTRQRQLHRRQSLEITRQASENIEAAIPYSDLIQYPADWPQITERRLRELDDAARESEADRRARLALEEPVPISFDANRLDNVIDFLRERTGGNFFVNWSALELAGVDQDTPITLHLENIPTRQALRLVLEQAGAAEFDPIGYSIIEGVVHISTERELQQTTDVRVYDIRDLLVQVPNFDEPPQLGAGRGGAGRGGGRGGGGGGVGGGGRTGGGRGGTGGGLFGDGIEDREEAREEMIEEITTLIRESIGRFDEWVEMGGDVSSLREMNGNLIVRSTPANHRELLGLLDQLRATRAIQISVEARFLLVDQNFLERVGVDMDAQIPDPGGDFGPIRMAQDSISLGSPSPSFLSPFSSQDGQGIFGEFGDGTGGGFTGSGRAFDLTASYLSDIEVNLIVTATQRHRRAISLTAPRVTFFNGQHAYVAVVREISFISDLDLVPDAFGFNPTADILEVGVFLGVEGVVSSDRRYVTLTLQPMLSSLADLRQIPFRAAEAIDVDDDEEDQIFVVEGLIELPETETTAVGATVSIPDQGTLLLGGQRIVQDREIEAGVPVLSKLPLVNRMFTNRGVVQDERTLLVLIKPTIVIQQEEEERRFPGLQENAGQFNVGNPTR